jgi:hypothetical protein
MQDISYMQSQAGKVPWWFFRIQASLLIWLKVVKQAREPLGFFVKLRDDSQAPAGRDALATFDHSDIRGLVTA